MFIQHVARTGRADFKKGMMKTLEPIKDCLRTSALLYFVSLFFSPHDLCYVIGIGSISPTLTHTHTLNEFFLLSHS